VSVSVIVIEKWTVFRPSRVCTSSRGILNPICGAQQLGCARERFEKRFEVGQPATFGVSDCSLEP
jgi:hypothetical protein